MAELSRLLQWHHRDGLITVGGYPCLLLDCRTHLYVEQAICDLLGEKQSASLRMSAARDAARELVASTGLSMGVENGAPMFPWAMSLFRAFGCGRLRLETIDGRRRGVGEGLFSSVHRIHGPQPMGAVSSSLEAMSAGWLAAAIELALARPANSVEVRQGGGASGPDGPVWFELGKGDGAEPREVVRGSLILPPEWSGPLVSPWVEQTAARLVELTAQAEGLRTGLGLPMHLTLAGYHLETILTSRMAAFSASAELGALLDAALVESWRLGFSAWLYELWPAWTQQGGGFTGEPSDALRLASDLMALLGLGRVRFTEIGDGGIRAESPGTLDALWCLKRAGVQRTACCLNLLGATQAVADLMALLRRGDEVHSQPRTQVLLTPSPFTPEVITCVSTGSSFTEVIAKRSFCIGGYVPVEAS
ncbi:MAG: hypothetical protein KGO50_10125 [Myxococcales bacterium]|nr:hypothetical protein [Myxococcales bacterium]